MQIILKSFTCNQGVLNQILEAPEILKTVENKLTLISILLVFYLINNFFFRVEQEIFLRRSSGDLEGRGSTSARRSFFRRKKHQRNGSRDSKELASFSNVAHPGWCSDSGTLHEDVSLCSYQRVERLDCEYYITNMCKCQ